MPDLQTPAQTLLRDATTDQLAEAIAAGIHVGLRRMAADREGMQMLRDTVAFVDSLEPLA